MTDRPILFSSPMVEALLDGRKTQTRRVLSPATASFGSAPKAFWDHVALALAAVDGRPEGGQYLHVPCHAERDEDCDRCREMGWVGSRHRLYPRIEVGDRLWVRETWRHDDFDSSGAILRADMPADAVRETQGIVRWKPGIHMPRWASRLTLTVMQVRVQRLQAITPDDAAAEGVDIFPRPLFRDLWDSLNRARGYGWDANPWVAAFIFTVERTNIDEVRLPGDPEQGAAARPARPAEPKNGGPAVTGEK